MILVGYHSLRISPAATPSAVAEDEALCAAFGGVVVFNHE